MSLEMHIGDKEHPVAYFTGQQVVEARRAEVWGPQGRKSRKKAEEGRVLVGVVRPLSTSQEVWGALQAPQWGVGWSPRS